MTNASKISKPGVEPPETSTGDRRRAVAQRRRQRREWYRLFAPPDVRHRRREARRWIEETTVRTTNPCVSERRQGERLFETLEERKAVADALYDKLRKDDPELYLAVERVEFEDGARDIGITLDEWKVQSARRSARVSKVRAELRESGLLSLPLSVRELVRKRGFEPPLDCSN